MTSTGCKFERAIWPRNTGQRIACLDRCQLIITGMSINKEEHGKPRLYVSVNLFFWSMNMAAMLGNSVVVVVVSTRPRAITLAMITTRKSTHGFPFLSYMSMGLRLMALGAAGAPLKTPVTTSNGTILTFWHLARLTTIVRLKRPYLFEICNQH